MSDREQDSGINDRLAVLNKAAGELADLCEAVNRKMEELSQIGVVTNLHVTDGAYIINPVGRHRSPPFLQPETFMVIGGPS